MMDKQLVSLVPKLSRSVFKIKIPLNLKNQPPSWKNNWTEKHLGLRLASQMERESANRKITNEILPSSALQSKT